MIRNKHLALGDIAHIQMGYSSLGRRDRRPLSRQEADALEQENPAPIKLLPFINVRDVRNGRIQDITNLHLIKKNWLDARTIILEEEDVLLLAHGLRFQAAVVPHELGGSVCSAYFYSIRIEENHVSPKYVCWYLNRSETKRQLMRLSVGSAIRFVQRKEINELPIPLPNIDVQCQIAELSEAMIKEQELTHALLDKRKKYINATLNNLLDKITLL